MFDLFLLYLIIGLFWMVWCIYKTTQLFGVEQNFKESIFWQTMNMILWPVSMGFALYRRIKK